MTADVSYTGHLAVIPRIPAERHLASETNISPYLRHQISSYLGPREAEEPIMAKQPETVTWTAFKTVITVATVAIGGGFFWLHSDLSDIKRGIDGVTKEVAGVRTHAAVTNTKLDELIREIRQKR